MDRRKLIAGGLGAGVAFATTSQAQSVFDVRSGFKSGEKIDWEAVRREFNLDPAWLNFAGFLLTSHPRTVRQAIERHRSGLDLNPAHYHGDHHLSGEADVREAASRYFGVPSRLVALTDSTSMGTALVVNGLKIKSDQEIIASNQSHLVTRMSCDYKSQASGCGFRKFDMYRDSFDATKEEMVQNVVDNIRENTKAIILTWVHSCTGVKIPMRAIVDEVRRINQGRTRRNRVLIIADGVHGFGIGHETFDSLGVDVFIAGTHKWIFGPRGTGIVCATDAAWAQIRPTIPTFTGITPGPLHTPGGFHSFEHRWALKEAFDFHLAIGKAEIEGRIQALNTRFKQGLRSLSRFVLKTPMDPEISAGINCFHIPGVPNAATISSLNRKKIIATKSPYVPSYTRIAPGLYNDEAEVDAVLDALG